MSEEEMEFCMIPIKNGDSNELVIYPLPQKHCHCRDGNVEHFSMYGRFNKDRTTMIPSSQDDVEAFDRYKASIMNKEP